MARRRGVLERLRDNLKKLAQDLGLASPPPKKAPKKTAKKASETRSRFKEPTEPPKVTFDRPGEGITEPLDRSAFAERQLAEELIDAMPSVPEETLRRLARESLTDSRLYLCRYRFIGELFESDPEDAEFGDDIREHHQLMSLTRWVVVLLKVARQTEIIGIEWELARKEDMQRAATPNKARDPKIGRKKKRKGKPKETAAERKKRLKRAADAKRREKKFQAELKEIVERDGPEAARRRKRERARRSRAARQGKKKGPKK